MIDINASIMEDSNAMLFDYYDAWQEVFFTLLMLLLPKCYFK